MEQKLRIGKPNVNIIEASGEITITENGTYDIREYGTANVSVKKGITSDYLTKLLDRSITSAPVELFEEISSVGDYAFAECHNLETVDLPANITKINSNSFSTCSSLKRVSLPSTLLEIDSYAFQSCENLESIVIPISVSTINYYAFKNCDSLTIYCEAPSQPEGWSSNWNYSNCPVVWGYLSESTTLNDITYHLSGSSLVATPVSLSENFSTLTEITIEKAIEYSGKTYTVKNIPNNFLSGNSVVEKLTIPFVGANLDESGTRSFSYIFGGTSSIPASLKEVVVTGGTSIGNQAFSNCKSLTNIVLPDSITSIGNGAFSGCTSLISIVIPNSVTSIAAGTFEACTNLTNINIPNSITSIGDNAFDSCTSLNNITIPSSVKKIGTGGFSDCASLTTITLSEGLEIIYDYAFKGSPLEELTLPSTITRILYAALYGSDLTFITFVGTKAQWNSIDLDPNWAILSKIKYVQCSDGQVQL